MNVPDELKDQMIAAELASEVVIAGDGYPSVVSHSNSQAAERAMAIFQPFLDRHEAMVRAKVAEEIEAGWKRRNEIAPYVSRNEVDAYRHAAKIARGVSR